MKRVIFWLLFVTAYYLAAMYRSQPLMTFCLGMLLLAGLSLVQSRLLRRGLSAMLPHRRNTAVVGKEQTFSVRVVNACPWGVGRCVLTIWAVYAGENSPSEVIRPKAVVGHGETRTTFSFSPPYCGLLLFRLQRIEVWDCLALFRSKKTLAEETETAVFPPPERLAIAFSAPPEGPDSPALESMGASRREEHGEIRQLREYRDGDRDRFIHWNLSARTGRLWLKEFEEESDRFGVLLLVWGDELSLLPQRSGFFRLLSALVLGLLETFPRVVVCWRGKENLPVRGWVADEEGCRDLLLKLYRLTAAGGLPRQTLTPEERRNAFLLDTGLGWYWEDTLLHQFPLEGLEREIREERFLL